MCNGIIQLNQQTNTPSPEPKSGFTIELLNLHQSRQIDDFTARSEVANATISCGAHNRPDDRDGADPRFCHEKTRDDGLSFWPDRQVGLHHPAVRALLCLYRLCRCIWLAAAEHGGILSFSGCFVGWHLVVHRRAGFIAVEHRLFPPKLSCRHRHHSAR